MLSPTVFQIDWNTVVLPVKCTPARCGSFSSTPLVATGSPGTKLITPGGSPASISRRMMYHAL